MSASPTPLLDFVRDMERHRIPPFRLYDDTRLWAVGCDMRQAAIAEDAEAVAYCARRTRLERLWRIENWLTSPKRRRRHRRITKWLHAQLYQRRSR